MKWVRTPPEVKTKFESASPADPRVIRKPMFGYPSLYLNGNMFAGTWQDKVVIRLSEAGRTRAQKIAKAVPFEPMPGRAMKEYVVLPRRVIDDRKALAAWIKRARDYALTLAPKSKENSTRRAAAPAAGPTGTKRQRGQA